jgi:hypothetical protein
VKAISPMSAEALEMYRDGKLRKVKDKRVCACGHPMSYHGQAGDIEICTPAKGRCRCTKSREILKTNNLRKFMYTTEGVGVNHALGKGIATCRVEEVAFEWLVDGHMSREPKCDMCLAEMLEPIPVAVDVVFDRPANASTGVDKLICVGCYASWTDSE